MHNLYVLNARTGKEPETAMLRVLCNGDVSAKLRRGGLDPRPYFEARRSRPVTFRVLHGHFEAAMHRPTRRERVARWWEGHRWPLLRGLVLMLAWLVLYLAVCLAMDAGNALADWLSAR